MGFFFVNVFVFLVGFHLLQVQSIHISTVQATSIPGVVPGGKGGDATPPGG